MKSAWSRNNEVRSMLGQHSQLLLRGHPTYYSRNADLMLGRGVDTGEGHLHVSFDLKSQFVGWDQHQAEHNWREVTWCLSPPFELTEDWRSKCQCFSWASLSSNKEIPMKRVSIEDLCLNIGWPMKLPFLHGLDDRRMQACILLPSLRLPFLIVVVHYV